eukprot:3941037-Rhodomonas_salina.1
MQLQRTVEEVPGCLSSYAVSGTEVRCVWLPGAPYGGATGNGAKNGRRCRGREGSALRHAPIYGSDAPIYGGETVVYGDGTADYSDTAHVF